MLSNRKSLKLLQNFVLILLATIIAVIIFIIDLHTSSNVAVASIYTIVILYSWLLPGKFASIYAAIICSVMTFAAVILSNEMASNASLI